ncbi:MAG: DUF5309 domain-containing protein [Deferribacteraceae bacterium]|jgi:hypothetical protein|nr:DUF5309 domain-containing protein [Deferribacteraceae bacterium]
MAIVSAGSDGKLSTGNRPSVYDVMELVGHDETPILSILERIKALGVTHSWIVDSIGDINVGYFNEISAPAAAAGNTKQETANAVQIFKTTAALSFDQNASSVYGGTSEAAWQKKKAAKQHLLKQEGAILGVGRNTPFDPPAFRMGNSSEGKMAGLPYYIALSQTAFVNRRKGNIFTADSEGDATGSDAPITLNLLDEFAAIPYENKARMTDIFVGVKLKRKINALFSRQLNNEDAAQTTVSAVELTTGRVKIHLHPYMSEAYGLDNAVIGGDFSFAKWAVLEEINRTLPTSDSAEMWEFYASASLQVTNAAAFAMLIGVS